MMYLVEDATCISLTCKRKNNKAKEKIFKQKKIRCHPPNATPEICRSGCARSTSQALPHLPSSWLLVRTSGLGPDEESPRHPPPTDSHGRRFWRSSRLGRSRGLGNVPGILPGPLLCSSAEFVSRLPNPGRHVSQPRRGSKREVQRD